MGYFPFFADIKGYKVFVAGGGPVAYRKCGTLLAFGCEITVFAREVSADFANYPEVTVVEDVLDESKLKETLKDYDMVIAATNKRLLNQKISMLCHEIHIPVNVADSVEESSFLFPSVVTRGELTIGINTAGKVPAFSGWLKSRLEEMIVTDMGQLIAELGDLEKKLRLKGISHKDRGKQLRMILDRDLADGKIFRN